MRKPTAVALALALPFLGGCARDATVRASPEQLVGRYYSGDGLGYNVWVQLAADGSYSADWHGCLGVYGEASGQWQAEGDQVVFLPEQENELLVGHLRTVTTVQHDGRLGLVRPEDLRGKRIRESQVFLKQEARP
ncbi:MAG: hypothetical protein MEQ07_02035 [Aquimonas sp.]|nr:hypothetical protein [Aquimonas sp.]